MPSCLPPDPHSTEPFKLVSSTLECTTCSPCAPTGASTVCGRGGGEAWLPHGATGTESNIDGSSAIDARTDAGANAGRAPYPQTRAPP